MTVRCDYSYTDPAGDSFACGLPLNHMGVHVFDPTLDLAVRCETLRVENALLAFDLSKEKSRRSASEFKLDQLFSALKEALADHMGDCGCEACMSLASFESETERSAQKPEHGGGPLTLDRVFPYNLSRKEIHDAATAALNDYAKQSGGFYSGVATPVYLAVTALLSKLPIRGEGR